MNKAVKAENEKSRRWILPRQRKPLRMDKKSGDQKAEGVTGAYPQAEGKPAIKLVNEAANQYFVGNAQVLRRLNC